MSLRQREPRERDRPYLGWIKELPCVGCARAGWYKAPSEAAHCKLAIAAHGWREGGIQEKSDDRKAVPLCDNCHRGGSGEHMSGQRAYWDRLRICPACLAAGLSAAYDAGESGGKVIWDFVRRARIKELSICCLEA